MGTPPWIVDLVAAVRPRRPARSADRAWSTTAASLAVCYADGIGTARLTFGE